MRSELDFEYTLDPRLDEKYWRDKFSFKLDKLMRSNNVGNSKLAEAIGKSSGTVSLYRRGQVTPDAYTIVLMAKALGCTVSALMEPDKIISPFILENNKKNKANRRYI